MATDFGYDTSATTSLRTGRFASGPRLVAEACFRRLITPRGSLRGGEEEQDYGLDLEGLVGTNDSASIAASLPGRIESELLKDERVQAVTATVVANRGGPSVTYTITIDGTTNEGPFSLQLLASEVSVSILGLTEGP